MSTQHNYAKVIGLVKNKNNNTTINNKLIEQQQEPPKQNEKQINSVLFYKDNNSYNKNSQSISQINIVDAILHEIKKLGCRDATEIEYIDDLYIPKKHTTIKLSNDIYTHIEDIELNKSSNCECKIQSISMRVFSEQKSIKKIMDYINNLREQYTIYFMNDFGEKLYYFSQIPPKKEPVRKYGDEPQHKQFVTFNKNLFSTYRTFKNIYLTQKEEIVNRVNFFMNNEKWYHDQGITHTLGFLFYGKPGCGKTSTIKAIANVTQRHIIAISLANVKTNTQLKNLFYSDEIIVEYHDPNSSNSTGTSQTKSLIHNIPINKRLYVFEDIDCDTDITHKRNFETHPSSDTEDDKITLASLLNILDGILEVPGRMTIFTTNHPEILDPALVRPGRVDITINFEEASRECSVEMFNNFFNLKLDEQLYHQIPDRVLTPAEINKIYLTYFNKPDEALKHLFRYNRNNNYIDMNTNNNNIDVNTNDNDIAETNTNNNYETTSDRSDKFF